MTTERRTIEFHEAFKHPVRSNPTTLCREEATLALALIEEEYLELVDALFPKVRQDIRSNHSSMTPVEWLRLQDEEYAQDVEDGLVDEDWFADCRPKYEPDLIATADALADLDVVINGAGIRHGFDMQSLSREVFTSNMSKLGADGKPIYHPNGKIAKGPGFKEPDIASALGLALIG